MNARNEVEKIGKQRYVKSRKPDDKKNSFASSPPSSKPPAAQGTGLGVG